ncbi:hypothetical protein NXU87_20420 [Candidatus Bacteroides intestinigallinarum]|jgi:hypothetical protein|uniref:hypothetical protein n=1 Tax=Bacteroides TaxID=816 RepID=UPI000E9A1B70|nr:MULTISPECIES: hypothetical protein [Bacteroides]MCS3178458.1 hypothetical protein [Candidatus Bacteroides intestinigallinarum]RGN54579.1 hypothetical protein DXB58_24005 [Bacteroides sp. OM05-10AA]RGQ69127.1 hypothetical protein DWY87_00090 [Bacteroides sp. AF27-33]
MKEIEAFQCDYCKKYSKSKSVIRRHESECYHNPVTKACATCGNYGKEHYKVDNSVLPNCFEGDVYSSRPMCKVGKSISYLKDGKVTVDLRNDCECWIQNKEE